MADVSVSSSIPDGSAAVAAAPRGPTEKGAGEAGFSKLLNQTGDQPQQSHKQSDQTSGADDKGEVDPSAHLARKVAKIQVLSLRQALADKETTQAETKAKDGSEQKPALDASKQQEEILDVLKMRQASAAKPDAKDKGEATEKSEKGDKKKKLAPTSADPSQDQSQTSDDAADAPAQTPVSDVLNLLAGPPAHALADTGHQQLQSGKTAEEKDMRKVGGALEGVKQHDALGMAASGQSSETSVAMPTDEAADAKTFRLTRADGRGGQLDLTSPAASEGAQSEAAADRKIENVTVLDSRRYLGLAGNTNSATVTAALAGDSEWAHAMRPESTLSNAAQLSSTGKVVNTLKIQMNPIDLGLVTATMRLSGETLNIDLKVETHEALRQLKADHDKIIDALRGQGYAIDNLTVSMTPTPDRVDSSQAGQQSQSQSQSGQQQMLQQGQQNQNKDRQRTMFQQPAGGVDDQSRADSEVSGVNGSERASGSVYL
ncbi:flagellar hook-length control protein FliK [Oryzifoliimicrobium ureilyticus]|uniref:flagellar hook-length control protein FliK n=1 Tax=Oryzifoliimicrobium ureilyticus TaxID=3113724 RepID=UPI0030764525